MNDLVEVRGTHVAYEMRNGARVEFANGDREVRMRSLGCPENILKQMRAHRSAKRSTQPVVARPFTESELAQMNGMTGEQWRKRCDYDRTHRAAQLGREIAQDADADLRARAARAGAAIAADTEQTKKDEELLERMQS